MSAIRAVYGLKQSSRNWNQVIDKWLRAYGFVPSLADPCVYRLVLKNGGVLLVALYVDDLLVAGNSRTIMDQFKTAIAQRFKMKDLGTLKWMLGMQIIRDRKARTLEIRQTAYIDQMLEKFSMADCKPVTTPADGVLHRLTSGQPNAKYQSLVGGVLYAAMVTRPDIAYAVQALSRHMQASDNGHSHMLAAMRVLRYLKGTRMLGIKFGHKTKDTTLIGYSDSDRAGDVDTRRSTTMAGGAVSWASKLQATVALSSTEAEYIAACAATQEAIVLRQLLSDIHCPQSEPTVIYEDNQSCICLSKNPVVSNRSKHIDIRYHFTREKVDNGEVELVYVSTEHQLADLLTKPLLTTKVEQLRNGVLGY